MEAKNKKFMPDGYIQIDEVVKDISQLIYMYNDNIMLVRSLNLVITKLNVAKEIISYSPRLPWQQIEQRLKELCKGASYHGVFVPISFITKYPERDMSNFGYLPVNI